MLGELTHRQMIEWEEFFRLEHLGDSREWRGDVRSAVMTSHIVGLFAKKGTPRPPIEDFMPSFGEPPTAVAQAAPVAETGTTDPAAAFRARMLDYAKRSKGKGKNRGNRGSRTTRKTES